MFGLCKNPRLSKFEYFRVFLLVGIRQTGRKSSRKHLNSRPGRRQRSDASACRPALTMTSTWLHLHGLQFTPARCRGLSLYPKR
jgi:hypothetical protein